VQPQVQPYEEQHYVWYPTVEHEGKMLGYYLRIYPGLLAANMVVYKDRGWDMHLTKMHIRYLHRQNSLRNSV
jgi:hypothetical protein